MHHRTARVTPMAEGVRDERSLTIVIPCFNEEASIESTVRSLAIGTRHLVDAGRLDWIQIVAVDDGSTDRTAARLAELADTETDFTWIGHGSNRGLGAALRSGIDAADGDLLFYTDADLPVQPSVIGTALALFDADERTGAVAAYRLGRRGEGRHRVVYSVLYNALIRVTLGLRVNDVNFAAKLMKASAVGELDLSSEGSFIDAEILAGLSAAGYSIAQFGASYHPRQHGVSTAASQRVIYATLIEMLTLSRRVRPPRQRRRAIR